MGFTSLFGFKYSPRPLTPALKLTDDVPEDVKAARLASLLAVGDDLTTANLARLVGTTQRVLVCGKGKHANHCEGRTEANEIVHVAGAEAELVGRMVDVQVTKSFKHSLEGRLASATASATSTVGRTHRALPLVT